MAATENRHGSVDAIKQVLSFLVAERQRLYLRGADPAELEANRQAILAMEWRLVRADAGENGSAGTGAAASTA
jgi:hypothetical protein